MKKLIPILILLWVGTSFAQINSGMIGVGGSGGSGSGDVATDAIWAAKGDVAIGTGVGTAGVLSHPGLKNYFLYTNAADTIAWGYASTNMISLLGSADYAAARTNLSLVPGTNVQAYSATLLSLAGLSETNGGIPYGTADNAYAWLAAGGAGKLLMGAGAGAPVWTTPTYPNAATTTGAYLRADGTNFIQSTLLLPNAGSAFYLPAFTSANTMGQLAASGATGQYLRGATGAIPAWSTLTLPDTATAFKLAAYTATNVMTELAAVGGTGTYLRGAAGAIPIWSTLTLPNAGTAFTLPVFSATNVMTELAAVGATGTILRGATGAIPAWSTSTFADTYAIGTLLHASAANVVTGLAAGTTGQILTGVTGAAPAWASALTGTFTFSNGATPGSIYFQEGSGGGTNKVQLIGPASTDDVIVTLPSATGTVALVKTEKIASFAWDGGGSAVATAGSKRCVLIPVAYTVTGYNMVVDQDPGAGTTILNLDKDAIGDGTALATTDMDGAAHAYPPTVPDNKVAINDTTITGWTTAVAANDMICAAVATNAVATWISLSIFGTK